MKKLGIIQSRGIGDILVALPIALHYHNQGCKILWPICEQFVSHFKETVPWVQWIPIPVDAKGKFFYDEPMTRLSNLGCTNILPLYQSLTGHPEFASEPWFQITGFDQYKYHAADVPFLDKWKLDQCITRNPTREQALYDRLVKNEQFAVYHVQGSDFKAPVDLSYLPKEWQLIEVTEQTDCIFDWLKIVEASRAAICVDSFMANLIDQMNLTNSTDCYWIPRSHIQLSPVLGGSWTILPAPPESGAAKQIFGSN